MDYVFHLARDYDQSFAPSVIRCVIQTFWHRVNLEKQGALFPARYFHDISAHRDVISSISTDSRVGSHWEKSECRLVV